MGLYGSNIYTRKGSAQKTLKGFAGSRIYYDGIPVIVRDQKGRSLSGVTLFAPNTVSGNPFTSETDANGGSIMSIDENSEVTATKGMISKTITRASENQLVIILGTPFLEGF